MEQAGSHLVAAAGVWLQGSCLQLVTAVDDDGERQLLLATKLVPERAASADCPMDETASGCL